MRHTLGCLVAIACIAGATGCSDSTAPAPQVDLSAFSTASTALSQLFSQPALNSAFGAVGGGFTSLFTRLPTRSPHALGAAAPGLVTTGFLPDSVLGRTYVQVGTGINFAFRYDPGRAGAPANGVRFVTLAFDTLTANYGIAEAAWTDIIDSTVTTGRALLHITVRDAATGRAALDVRLVGATVDLAMVDSLTAVVSDGAGASATWTQSTSFTTSNGNLPVVRTMRHVSIPSVSLVVDGSIATLGAPGDVDTLSSTVGGQTIRFIDKLGDDGFGDGLGIPSDAVQIAVDGHALGSIVLEFGLVLPDSPVLDTRGVPITGATANEIRALALAEQRLAVASMGVTYAETWPYQATQAIGYRALP